jgi:TetR/AcrR family transcriptional repressor for divergent bdcA
VNDTEKIKKRGRPRSFDRDAALETARALFHAHGYEGVGVAALADAMGINPPSLYAAFGCKAALYDEVLGRYDKAAAPLRALLAPEADPAVALPALLREAARIYAADPAMAGCLVLEGARSADPEAACRARNWLDTGRGRIRDFVALTHPDQADVVADYVAAVMSGMSADARAGHPVERLTAIADMAALAIGAMLERS